MEGRLYILSGASGCGKTTLMNEICGVGRDPFDASLNAVRAPKYSERERRDDLDDVTKLSRIDLTTVDIAYVINNTRYGLRLSEIEELLTEGKNVLVVLSDFRVVRKVRDALKERARCVYISSAIDADRLRRIQQERLGFRPNAHQKEVLQYHFARAGAAARLNWWDRVSNCVADLERDWRAYATDAKSTEIRAGKIRAFHIRYIEHLHLFNHVILNYTEDAPGEMSIQLRSIIQTFPDEEARRIMGCPIFVVAAASGGGKGTLFEMLNLIAGGEVRVISKLGLRPPKEEDRRDGMIALLRSSDDPEPEWPAWWSKEMVGAAKAHRIPEEYNLRWSFHEGSTEYAISEAEVRRNLELGVPQIFTSNMAQFDRFRSIWRDNAVFLYLHRLSSDEEHRAFVNEKWGGDPEQIRVRIKERRTVHEDYLAKIGQFHHVLLNTTFQEDLYDQMFSLLDFYGGIGAHSHSTSRRVGDEAGA